MKIFTKEIEDKLKTTPHSNMRPIFKLFCPWGAATWLITCEEDGILYGYAQLFRDTKPEWGGLFSREEMLEITGPFGLKIERDLHFKDDPSVNYLNLDTLAGV